MDPKYVVGMRKEEGNATTKIKEGIGEITDGKYMKPKWVNHVTFQIFKKNIRNLSSQFYKGLTLNILPVSPLPQKITTLRKNQITNRIQ